MAWSFDPATHDAGRRKCGVQGGKAIAHSEQCKCSWLLVIAQHRTTAIAGLLEITDYRLQARFKKSQIAN
jgi:hypothetical protein